MGIFRLSAWTWICCSRYKQSECTGSHIPKWIFYGQLETPKLLIRPARKEPKHIEGRTRGRKDEETWVTRLSNSPLCFLLSGVKASHYFWVAFGFPRRQRFCSCGVGHGIETVGPQTKSNPSAFLGASFTLLEQRITENTEKLLLRAGLCD